VVKKLLNIIWKFRDPGKTDESAPLFSRTPKRADGQVFSETVSFFLTESLYEEMQSVPCSDSLSTLIRASIRLGVGTFTGCPVLMKKLDRPGKKTRSFTLSVTEQMANELVVAFGTQKSLFIRASIELGIIYFSKRPEHIRTVEEI
jgi:hypothetical protein